METYSQLITQFADAGYTLVPELLNEIELAELLQQSQLALGAESAAIRAKAGAVYAARNVLDLWPVLPAFIKHTKIKQLLQEVMGPEVFLVRGLYFDKPPEQTWSLPWHKDLLIAVAAGQQMPPCYSVPRLRMGVPHTEPPVEVLESMVTVRLHLDDMTPENGPLEVLPGSHRSGKQLQLNPFQPILLNCRAGDGLLMRPLLAHASGKSIPGCQQHRRILHLEFSPLSKLAGNIEWYWCLALD